jgi:hypothetical protein
MGHYCRGGWRNTYELRYNYPLLIYILRMPKAVELVHYLDLLDKSHKKILWLYITGTFLPTCPSIVYSSLLEISNYMIDGLQGELNPTLIYL